MTPEVCSRKLKAAALTVSSRIAEIDTPYSISCGHCGEPHSSIDSIKQPFLNASNYALHINTVACRENSSSTGEILRREPSVKGHANVDDIERNVKNVKGVNSSTIVIGIGGKEGAGGKIPTGK